MDATTGTGGETIQYESTADIGDSFFDFSYYPTTIIRGVKHLYPLFGSLEDNSKEDDPHKGV